MQPKSFFRVSAIAATLTLAAASSFAHQQFGEAYPSEAGPAMSQQQTVPTSPTVAAQFGEKSRQSVRDELKAARQAGATTRWGEAGDTERVISARDSMNQDQAVAIADEYRADQDRQLALADAEEIRAQAEADADALMALANGEVSGATDGMDVIFVADEASPTDVANATDDAYDVYEVYSVYLIDTEGQ